MIRLPDVPAAQRPMLRFLLVLTVASLAGLQGWRTLFNNFAVEVAGLGGDQVGMIQAVREVPGFLALLAVWVMLLVAEHRLSAFSILVLGLGTAATGLFPTYLGLACTTLAMSFGFHYFETTNQSLTLQYFDRGAAPLVLGALRSAGAATNIVVGVLIFAVSSLLDYRQMFLLIGLLIAGVGVWGLLQSPTDRDLVPQHKHMVFRRRYGLFYFLTFMAGARRQIFIAFAVFLLVQVFAFSVKEVAILFVVNNLVGYMAGPLLGRAIVRFGERRVLSVGRARMPPGFAGRRRAAGLRIASRCTVDTRVVGWCCAPPWSGRGPFRDRGRAGACCQALGSGTRLPQRQHAAFGTADRCVARQGSIP